MGALRELFLTLGLEADEASFATATAAVHLLEHGLELVKEVVEKVGEALVEAVVGTAEYAHGLERASVKTGVAAEELQVLELAAGQTGGTFEGVTQGLTFLNRNLYEAATQGGEAAVAFQTLGIHTRDAGGKIRDTHEVFLDVADAISKLPVGAARGALAMKLMGRGGAEMLPLLAVGREGILKFKEQAESLGTVMGEEQVEASGKFALSMDLVHRAVTGLSHEVGALLIEHVQPLVQGLIDWFIANRKLISQRIKQFVEGLSWAMEKLGALVAGAVENWRLFAVLLGGYVVAQFALLEGAAVKAGWEMAVAGGKAMWAWIKAVAPLVLLIAAFAIGYLAADDFMGALKGTDSLIGDIGPKWTAILNEWSQPHAGDPWWLKILREAERIMMDIEGSMHRFQVWLNDDGMKNFLASYGIVPRGGNFQQQQGLALAEMIQQRATVGQMMGGGASGPLPGLGGPSGTNTWRPDVTSNITVNVGPGADHESIKQAVKQGHDEWWQAWHAGPVLAGSDGS